MFINWKPAKICGTNQMIFLTQSFLKTCCFFVVVSTNSTMMVGSIEEVPVWQDKFHIYIFCFVL